MYKHVYKVKFCTAIIRFDVCAYLMCGNNGMHNKYTYKVLTQKKNQDKNINIKQEINKVNKKDRRYVKKKRYT